MSSNLLHGDAPRNADQCTLHPVQPRSSGGHNGEQATTYRPVARTERDPALDAAWDRYKAENHGTHKPIPLMHSLLDSYAREWRLVQAVRSYVTAAEGPDRIVAFGALVKAVSG